jgi:hypothetical protein
MLRCFKYIFGKTGRFRLKILLKMPKTGRNIACQSFLPKIDENPKIVIITLAPGGPHRWHVAALRDFVDEAEDRALHGLDSAGQKQMRHEHGLLGSHATILSKFIVTKVKHLQNTGSDDFYKSTKASSTFTGTFLKFKAEF